MVELAPERPFPGYGSGLDLGLPARAAAVPEGGECAPHDEGPPPGIPTETDTGGGADEGPPPGIPAETDTGGGAAEGPPPGIPEGPPPDIISGDNTRGGADEGLCREMLRTVVDCMYDPDAWAEERGMLEGGSVAGNPVSITCICI